MEEFALIAALSAASSIYVFARLRRSGGFEWRRRWRQLTKERRRRISRAVRAGRALPDPEDAAFAVELANRAQATSRMFAPRSRRLHMAFDLATAAFEILPVILAWWAWGATALLYGWPLVLFAVSGPIVDLATRSRFKRMEQSSALNAQVVEAAKPRRDDPFARSTIDT